MIVTPQHSAAILETDHHLTVLEVQRIKAELQAIGFAAVLLPVGVSTAAIASCALEDEAETD